MKRLVILVAVLAALVGCGKSAGDQDIVEYSGDVLEYTGEEIPLDESVKKYREIFHIDEEFESLTTEESNESDNKQYILSMVSDTDDYKYVNLVIDDYGNLISFDGYTDTDGKPIISKEDAETMAEDLLLKLYGPVAEEFLLDEDQYSYMGDDLQLFEYTRTVNSIPVPGDTVSIIINTVDESIYSVRVSTTTNYDFSSDDYFEDPKDIESIDKAYDKFKEVNRVLSGVIDYNQYNRNNDPEYMSVAELMTPLIPIEAADLIPEYITPVQIDMDYADGDQYDESAVFDDTDQVVLDHASLEDVEKKARKLLSIKDKYKLRYSDHTISEDGVDVWVLDFSGEDMNSIGVTLKGEDLELESYYKYGDKKKEVKQDLNKAKDVAQKFVIDKGHINPDDIELLGPEDQSLQKYIHRNNEKEYQFKYIRKDKDQYVLSDSITVVVDESMSVISYNKNWDPDLDLSYVDRDLEIDTDEFFDIVSENIEFGPVYIRCNEGEEEKVKIYYTYIDEDYDPVYIVDLESLEMVDRSGMSISGMQATEYTDIDQATYPEIIKAMMGEDIYYYGDALRPKDPVTQVDLARLLLREMMDQRSIMASSDEEIQDYAYFIDRDEWDPQRKMTQRDIAKYLVRLADMENVAEMTDILITGYDDIAPSDPDYGYILIAKSKGYITTEGENLLSPDKIIDRETALEYYYNFRNKD